MKTKNSNKKYKVSKECFNFSFPEKQKKLFPITKLYIYTISFVYDLDVYSLYPSYKDCQASL